MELISCSQVKQRKGGKLTAQRIKVRDLIQLFTHLDQMQGAGIPLLDALSDIRDTTENDRLRDIMSEIYRDVSEGSSLSEAMANHPRVFSNLYISLIASGETTGDMNAIYRQLVKYLRWVDEMQRKVKKATRYPIILVVVVVLVVVVMMGFVVPEIVGFIRNLDQELPIYTTALMATSEFFKQYWWAVLLVPIFLVVLLKVGRKLSGGFAYKLDQLWLRAPIAGNLIRKINIARFAQTFGALYSSGIDVLGALKSARQTVGNLALGEALENVHEQVSNGAPLSDAFNSSGEFPSMVVRMLRIGEESGNLTEVLDQVSEFYTNDVDEAVQGLITMIEPLLTALLGGMILWIAVAVFGPIYSSFEDLDI